jgi:hypothetical protein
MSDYVVLGKPVLRILLTGKVQYEEGGSEWTPSPSGQSFKLRNIKHLDSVSG